MNVLVLATMSVALGTTLVIFMIIGTIFILISGSVKAPTPPAVRTPVWNRDFAKFEWFDKHKCWLTFRPSIISSCVLLLLVAISWMRNPATTYNLVFSRWFIALFLAVVYGAMLLRLPRHGGFYFFVVLLVASGIITATYNWVVPENIKQIVSEKLDDATNTKEKDPMLVEIQKLRKEMASIKNPSSASSEAVEIAPTLPEMYGGKDGKGFFIWAPPMQPGKDAWSVRVDPNGQRECDKAEWNNTPDMTSPKSDNSAVSLKYSPFTNPEFMRSPPKYGLVPNRVDKSIPVEFVINEDFLHPHDLPYSGNLSGIHSMRFRSKTDTGVWIHVYWRRIR